MKAILYRSFLFAAMFSVFQFSFASDTWPYLVKYMVTKGDGTLTQNEAVMWIGDESKPVKGVILTSMTRNEYEFTHDPTIRQMAAENGIAIIFMYSERTQDYYWGGSMSVFDPSLGHDTVLLKILKNFADLSGKPEIEHAPWLTFGHSTSGLFARYIAWWKPERMFGVILYKSGGYVPPEFVEDPDTATFLNIPWLSVAARNDKFGPGQDGWLNMRRDMMPWREMGALMSEIVEPTMEEGHSLWRPFNAPYFAMWIQKAAEYKIPANQVATEQPLDLLTIGNNSGMLSDTAIARLIDKEELSDQLLRYSFDTEPGEKIKMFWHFDDEMALTWVNYHHKAFDDFTPPRDSTLTGNIKYWRSKKPFESLPENETMVLGKSKKGEYSPVYADQTQSDGSFSIIGFDRKIKIEKEIPGDYSTPEMSRSILKSINGYDAMLLKKICDESADYTPGLEDMLAGDVNMDGIIDTSDFNSLVRRAVLKTPEFPQQWNYQNNEIPVLIEPSLDYVFFDSSKTRFNVEAKISKTYPDDDGKGYSRHRIPSISNEVIIPYEIGNPYPAFHEATIFGLLLGDMDGSDAMDDQTIDENNKVILGLGNSEDYGDNLIRIPLYIQSLDSKPIKSIDVEVNFTEGAFNFINLESQQSDHFYENFMNNNLTIISFTNEAFSTEQPVAWISSSIPGLAVNEIISLNTFVNGVKCLSEIKTNPLKNDNFKAFNDWKLYPNPAGDEIILELNNNQRGESSWKILDYSGRMLLGGKLSENNKNLININSLETGSYIFQLQTNNELYRKNFIKQ